MCLDKLMSIKNKDPNKVRYGYKVFVKNDEQLNLDMFFEKSMPPVYKKKWIHESAYRMDGYKRRKKINIMQGIEPIYPFGFHVFLYRKDAIGWMIPSHRQRVVCKVKYRKLVASGYQLVDSIHSKNGTESCRVDVAKEIYVMEDTDA